MFFYRQKLTVFCQIVILLINCSFVSYNSNFHGAKKDLNFIKTRGDRMLKIGDFSKVGKVSIRMLRHYDQIGIFKPAQIDEQTGYRSYSIDQLPRLNRIKFLKDLGFSLQEVMELVDEQISIDEMKRMLQKKQYDLEHEIEMAQINLKAVRERLQIIENEGNAPQFDVNIKRVESYGYVSLRKLVPHVNQTGTFCYDMYTTLYRELARLNLTPIGPETTYYHNEDYSENDLDVEAGTVVSVSSLPIIKEQAPRLQTRIVQAEETVAFLIYKGSFEGVDRAVIELLKWVGLNDWGIKGPMRELHLSGPAHRNGKLDSSPVIELQIPVEK